MQNGGEYRTARLRNKGNPTFPVGWWGFLLVSVKQAKDIRRNHETTEVTETKYLYVLKKVEKIKNWNKKIKKIENTERVN